MREVLIADGDNCMRATCWDSAAAGFSAQLGSHLLLMDTSLLYNKLYRCNIISVNFPDQVVVSNIHFSLYYAIGVYGHFSNICGNLYQIWIDIGSFFKE